jgi:hypothetical protein
MVDFIIISSFIILWLFLSFVGWYLHHIIVAKNDLYEDDVCFLFTIIALPIVWMTIVVALVERLNFFDFENKIRERLDRFFGI